MHELQLDPQWGFVPVRGKAAYENGWSDNPHDWLTLNTKRQFRDGIGLLSGVHKRAKDRAYVFVDFDGEFAFTFYEEGIGPLAEITESGAPMWSSGRPARFQAMFRVPAKYWPYLSTTKIFKPETDAEKQAREERKEKREGFEMRWTGCQSVIPDSIHPDTRLPYVWLVKPTGQNIEIEIPDALLTWWLDQVNVGAKSRETETTGASGIGAERTVCWEPHESAASGDDVREILRTLRRHRPDLDYDAWMKVTCACMQALGKDAGLAVMKEVYPEEDDGEYKRYFADWHKFDAGKSPGIGTIIHLIRQFEPDYMPRHGISAEELAQLLEAKKKRRHASALRASWEPPCEAPIERLPEAMQEAMAAFKVKSNVAYEMSLQCVLAVANFAAQGACDVDTNGIDGVKPISEFFIGLAPSGCAKTSLFSPLTRPISSFQANWREERKLEVALYERAMKQRERAIKTHDKKDWESLEAAEADLRAIEAARPKPPRGDTFLVEKPTYNGMVDVLEGVPFAGLFTPEGTEFINGWGFQDPIRAAESATMLTKLT
jgi:hypothetical protein